jgi:hypothetical protein
VVPQLVGKGLESIGKKLRKSGEKEVVTIAASHNFEIAESLSPCIQIVHGLISPVETGARDGMLAISGMNSVKVDNRLKKQKIYLADIPRLFLEVRVLNSQDKSSLALALSHVSYNGPVRSNSTIGGASRALAADVVFHGSGVAIDDKTATTAQLVVGELLAGTQLKLFDESVEDLTTWNPPIATPWFKDFRKNPETSKGKPVTITVKVFETRAENSLLLALADVFDSSKEVLQQELEKTLLESKRREAEVAELEADSKLLTAYYTNLVAAESAILDYCEASADSTVTAEKKRLETSKAAKLAQLKVNIDAVAVGLTPPYSEAQLVKVSGGALQDVCSP